MRTIFHLLPLASLLIMTGGNAMADTTVKCTTPQIEVNSGDDGTPPRMTIHCLGGSNVTGIDHYAVEISPNPTVAQLAQEAIQSYLTIHKNAASITFASNLNDTSGSQWGCSQTNCRILDYAFGP